MSPVDIVGLLVPLTYFALLAVEKWRPARAFPQRRGWTWIGIAFLLLIGTVSSVVPLLINPHWLAAHRWLDGTRLGVPGGVLAGILVVTGLSYWVHRTMHAVPLVWRLTH